MSLKLISLHMTDFSEGLYEYDAMDKINILVPRKRVNEFMTLLLVYKNGCEIWLVFVNNCGELYPCFRNCDKYYNGLIMKSEL